jgi:cardiolipin synthase A/B
MLSFSLPSLSWWDLYVYSELFIRIIMILVIPPRRSPQAAKSWLVLVMFLPWPGVLTYWLVGRLKLPKWRYEQFRKIPVALGPASRLLIERGNVAVAKVDAQWLGSNRLAQSLGYFRALEGNSVEVLTDYDEGLRRLQKDIDGARDHVHLLFYIFAYDKATIPVIEALARAAARGVTCRVLYDAVGSSAWKKKLRPVFEQAGVEAREVMPVNLFFGKSLRADLRNHRKIAVIDGETGYTGSQNLIDSQCGPDLFNEELMARIQGPVVSQLQYVFLSDWYLETEVPLFSPTFFPESPRPGAVIAQVLPSGPDFERQNAEHLIIELCHQAKSRIVLTTPYFIPSEPLVQALQTAVLRGVQVHLFLSRKSDNPLVNWAQASYFEELLEGGVRIYLYEKKFLHAKHMTFDDDIGWIGSSNLDIRSFELNAEINVLFYDRTVVDKMKQVHAKYLRYCETLELSSWLERPRLIQIGENLARLWSPLL